MQIKRLHLVDFLSHEDTTIDFDSDEKIILVVGNNGSGKSSILEAVFYVVFGTGRESNSHLSRLSGNGCHCVEVWFDDDFFISRSWNGKSGKLFVELNNGMLVLYGKDASQIIESRIGMTRDEFTLTSFYGMGAQKRDVFLSGTASERLEALHKLARFMNFKDYVNKFKEGRENVDSEKEQCTIDIHTLTGKQQSLTESIVDVTDDLKEARVVLDKCQKDSNQFSVKQKEFDDIKCQKSLIEGKLGEARKNIVRLRSRKDLEQKKVKSLQSDLVKLKDHAKNSSELLKLFNAQLKSEGITKEILNKLKIFIAEVKTHLDLLKTIQIRVKDSDVTECPVCASKLDQSIVQRVESEIEKFDSKRLKFQEKADYYTTKLQRQKELIDELERHKDRIFLIEESISMVNFFELEQEEEKCKESITVFENDLRKVCDVFQSLEESVKKAEHFKLRLREAQRKYDSLKTLQEENVIRKKKLITLGTKMADLIKKKNEFVELLEGYDICLEAFGRYGIPLMLLDKFCLDLAFLGSSVLNNFMEGQIIVEKVETHGKYGIHFYLEDGKGRRAYKNLSEGEKVMFYVSLRMAISQLCVKKPFPIFLDEVTGTLSEEKRQKLFKVITTKMSWFSSQIFVVSHNEIPDIADKVIKVQSVGVNSRVIV